MEKKNKIPSCINSDGLEVWNAVWGEIGEEFMCVNRLSVIMLCIEYQNYIKYSKDDPIAMTPNGFEQMSASAIQANRSIANFQKILKSLGLTRFQLTKGNNGEKDEDEFEQFANED